MFENISFQVSFSKKSYQSFKSVAEKRHTSEADFLLNALCAYLDMNDFKNQVIS